MQSGWEKCFGRLPQPRMGPDETKFSNVSSYVLSKFLLQSLFISYNCISKWCFQVNYDSGLSERTRSQSSMRSQNIMIQWWTDFIFLAILKDSFLVDFLQRHVAPDHVVLLTRSDHVTRLNVRSLLKNQSKCQNQHLAPESVQEDVLAWVECPMWVDLKKSNVRK